MLAVTAAYIAYRQSREHALGINPRHVFTAGWDARQVEIDELRAELDRERAGKGW